MKTYPKISIVTPSFNQSEYIEETILSVINQNYPNLEYIIIDGGSTDRSIDIIKKYEKHIHYWISEKDNGMYEAINKGFRKSTGEVLCWINSDDIFFENSLFKVAEIFSQLNYVDWITGRCGYIDKEGNKTRVSRKKLYNQELLKSGFYKSPYSYLVNQNVVFWRRELWEKVGGVNEDLKCASDFVLWTKFANEAELFFVDYIFSAFRNHGENLTYRLGIYAKEAMPYITFNYFALIKILFGKQYEGKQIEKIGNEYIITSEKLNPSYLQPINIIKNLIKYFIKKILNWRRT
ncbi:MAG: glycosyltransferase [Mariniphaga sp.]|nr:glycosyltransferase [Mariniphaga sp.]